MRVLFCAFVVSAIALLSGLAETTFGPGQVIYENGEPSPMIGSILSISMGTAGGQPLPHAFIATDEEALYAQSQSAVGVFNDPVSVSSGVTDENSLQVLSRDIDGLHGDDLLLLRGSANVVEWYPNTSTGDWGAAVTIDTTGNVPAGAAIADLNNDQALDIAVVMSNDLECVWYRQDPVSHSFTKETLSGSTGEDTFPQTVAVGDINGDTFPDILTAARSPGQVLAYLSTDASGNFGSLTSLFLHDPGVTELNLEDVDVDGDLDLFVFEPYGVRSSLTLYKNDGAGSFSDPVLIFEGQAST